MQYCPHCMRPTADARCPSCGGDTSWRGQKGIDLPVGTVLTGGNGLRTYQIGAARGKGGFGITYIALETNSGRRMAVKEYFPTRCAFRGGNEVDVQTMSGQEDVFQSGMNSFLDEGKMLLSQDDLPCVVHVIDYFRANGTAYLVMEYLDGVALHTQVTRMGGRIPVNELMPRLAPLMRDIGQLHRRGVIHRDISPDNIMWMPDGTLKLLDFGSARSMENGKSMTVLMKHGFSPIEQYRSRGQGPYTDIYALAATIYYCVTGVIPPAAVERLDEDGLQSPTALGAALTVDQETALLWALSIQPNARPQSMEVFSSMLYQEAPPYGFTSTGADAFISQGQQNQTGSWTGGSAFTSQSQRNQTGSWTDGSAFTSQSQRNQTGSWTDGSTFTGQSQQNQTGSWTGGNTFTGQGQTGGRTGGGDRNKTPILIGGVAAAVVILVAAVIIALNGRGNGPVIESSHLTESSSMNSPTPVIPTPTIRTGVTSDGYLYEIVDRDYVVLTGYEGAEGLYLLPDYVENVPVTRIADRAFAGVDINTYGDIWLPEHLETIGNNAFQGCDDLLYVVALSDVATTSTSFSGCDNLWFVFSYDAGVSGWKLPDGARLFYAGMDTGVGPLEDFERGGELLGGELENGDYVLLDVMPGTTYVDLDDVVWICSGALDNLESGATVDLGEDTVYPYEMFSSDYSWNAPNGAMSDMWLLSCKAADAINEALPSGAGRMQPDLGGTRAAMVRAEEISGAYQNTRPDGQSTFTALEAETGYRFAWAWWGYESSQSSAWNTCIETAEEKYSMEASEVNGLEDHVGEYFNRIGASYYVGEDGKTYWFSFGFKAK